MSGFATGSGGYCDNDAGMQRAVLLHHYFINIGVEMNDKVLNDNIIEIPNRDNHNCFGCSPVNDKGLMMRFFSDGETVFSNVIVPDHLCGWDKMVHGGVISTILDEVMSWGAIYLLKRLILTKNISVDFIKPVLIEEPLRAEGVLVEKISEREAVMEGLIYNSKGEICARSKGIFALFTLEAIKKMGIFNDDLIKNIEEAMLAE